MAECRECGRGYDTGIREFCSEKCLKKNIQRRINDATEKESSHTNKFSKADS